MKRIPESIIIPGIPVGKARPRIGQGGRFYSPKVGAFEATVIALAQQAWGNTPDDALYEVGISVHRRMPDSMSKKRKAALLGQPAGAKPDLSNVECAVWDALQGIIYHDDKQVASCWATRFHAARDQVVITVREVMG